MKNALSIGAMLVGWSISAALCRGALPSCLILGLGLPLGCSKKSDTNPGAASTSAEVAAPATGTGVRVVVDQHGFAPASLTVPKGQAGSTVPVTFLRTTDETCAKEVVFPEVGIKKDLPLKSPVTVDVPADRERTLTFQCGMAMYKGSLVVK